MPTVVQLRQACKNKGIKGYSKMNKAQLLKACGNGSKPTPSKKSTSKPTSKPRKKSPTVSQLRKMCKDKGIKGYSKWNKSELLKKCGNGKPSKPSKQSVPVPDYDHDNINDPIYRSWLKKYSEIEKYVMKHWDPNSPLSPLYRKAEIYFYSSRELTGRRAKKMIEKFKKVVDEAWEIYKTPECQNFLCQYNIKSKKDYFKWLRLHHPDKCSPDKKEECTRRFQKLNPKIKECIASGEYCKSSF